MRNIKTYRRCGIMYNKFYILANRWALIISRSEEALPISRPSICKMIICSERASFFPYYTYIKAIINLLLIAKLTKTLTAIFIFLFLWIKKVIHFQGFLYTIRLYVVIIVSHCDTLHKQRQPLTVISIKQHYVYIQHIQAPLHARRQLNNVK